MSAASNNAPKKSKKIKIKKCWCSDGKNKRLMNNSSNPVPKCNVQ